MKAIGRLYIPAILAIGLLLMALNPAAWFAKQGGIYVSLQPGNWESLPKFMSWLPPIVIKSDWEMRIALCVAALIALAYYLVLDFSTMIAPEHDILLYFDDEGVAKAVKDIKPAQCHQLKVVEDFTVGKRDYLARLTVEISKSINLPAGYNLNPDYIGSRGRTTFKVRKLSGMRRYKFEEADGWLEHSLSDISLKFMTQFEKVNSPYDITEIDLLQTLLRNQFLTMARFRQHVHGNQQRLTEIPEDVIGITKIRILPVPALEQSLYLAITDEGLAVPVAYAIYSKLGST